VKQAAAFACPPSRVSRAALLAFFGTVVFEITACSLSGPPPAEYVLGTMPAATETTLPQSGLPVVEVNRVQLPDYLDTTDILERRSNQLVPSPTGRWGERLSVGMTRALIASLAAQLPRLVVTAMPVGRPTRQILVDVAAFESRPDHHVVLAARWTILDGATRRVLIAEQASLVKAIEGNGDDALVAAMSRAVDDLAGRVAAGIERDLRSAP
jgi:uncharacterized lipoprotein YmbA